MDLERLRRETRSEHQATESVMPLMNADLTLQQYVDVLGRLDHVVRGWESWAQRHAPADLVEVVRDRRRADLLRQDLEWAGTVSRQPSPRLGPSDFPGFDAGVPRSRAGFLGAMYVMEGSTLGGQYIARHLESVLGFEPGEGDAYFRGYGKRTGEMWGAFKVIMTEIPEADTESVIAAALAMYRWFREAMSPTPLVESSL